MCIAMSSSVFYHLDMRYGFLYYMHMDIPEISKEEIAFKRVIQESGIEDLISVKIGVDPKYNADLDHIMEAKVVVCMPMTLKEAAQYKAQFQKEIGTELLLKEGKCSECGCDVVMMKWIPEDLKPVCIDCAGKVSERYEK